MSGKEYVGKTAILKRFLLNEYKSAYTPTVEETHSEEFEVRGRKTQVEMIDTSGSYRQEITRHCKSWTVGFSASSRLAG